MMVLGANDRPLPANTEEALSRFAAGMYITGAGTYGGGMAQRLRDHGLTSAEFTTTGSIGDITSTLRRGQPVPLGVWSLSGTVLELPGGSSTRYPTLTANAQHDRTFGASGHWLVVDGFEGPATAPTHFTVSDPDSGARLRLTSAQLLRAAGQNGGLWMVRQ